MMALVRGEAIKLRSTRTALGFAAAALLLVLAVVLVSTLATDPRSVADKRAAIGFGGVLSLPLAIFGVVGATGEYRHRTLAPALLVAPGRTQLLVARTIAYGAAGVLIGVAMLVLTFAVGIPLLSGAPGPGLGLGDYLRVGAGGVAAAGLSAAFGVGLGTVVTNQVAAVVGFVVYLFIVEPLVSLLSDTASKYTLGQAQSAVGAGTGADLLPWGLALVVLVAWTAGAVVAGAVADAGRDVV
jgi:ABC-2 type transport system permease protein